MLQKSYKHKTGWICYSGRPRCWGRCWGRWGQRQWKYSGNAAAVPAAAANVTVNMYRMLPPLPPRWSLGLLVQPQPPVNKKTKRKQMRRLERKIVEVLDDMKKEEEGASALDYAFASHSKQMKAFLSDSQQEECLQEIRRGGHTCHPQMRRVRKLATSKPSSASASSSASGQCSRYCSPAPHCTPTSSYTRQSP